jgi:hypothetical protein
MGFDGQAEGTGVMEERITGSSIANTVRMWRELYNGAFLIVEGTSDVKFCRWFVDNESCKVLDARGRQNVLDAVAILNKDGFIGALGIVDADFTRVMGAESPVMNVVLTDGHDLECLLLASPALDKVVETFGSPERVDVFVNEHGAVLATVLARNAMPLGYLLHNSLMQALGLDFEELAFGNFVDYKTLRIDIAAMVKTVLNKSQKHHLDAAKLAMEVELLCGMSLDHWQVSRGHDIVAILSIGLQRTFAARAKHHVSPEALEASLLLAYGKADFEQTQLYRSIVQWERDNPSFSILACT